jgi:hypothetical protein
LLEGEMPARGGTAGAFELAQVTFEEGAGLRDFSEREFAGAGVAIGDGYTASSWSRKTS